MKASETVKTIMILEKYYNIIKTNLNINYCYFKAKKFNNSSMFELAFFFEYLEIVDLLNAISTLLPLLKDYKIELYQYETLKNNIIKIYTGNIEIYFFDIARDESNLIMFENFIKNKEI